MKYRDAFLVILIPTFFVGANHLTQADQSGAMREHPNSHFFLIFTFRIYSFRSPKEIKMSRYKWNKLYTFRISGKRRLTFTIVYAMLDDRLRHPWCALRQTERRIKFDQLCQFEN